MKGGSYYAYRGGELPWRRIRPYLPWVVGLAVGLWVLSTSLYQVDADSEAVVLRFGRIVGRAGPGLHVKMPFGIDTVRRVRVRRVETLEFGFRTRRPGRVTIYEPTTEADRAVSLMLTGDLNAAVVEWIVQYRVNRPEDYLFAVVDVPETIRDASEAVMRRLVGDRSVDEVITTGREEIARLARRELQDLLDRYRCGVEVVAVKLQDATPPEEVKDAFDAVNRARQERDRLKNEAEAERNRRIPEARGKRDRKIREAEGYARRLIAEARGRSAAFLAVWNAYRLAPEATHLRLYLEAMEEVLAKAGRKTIVDSRLEGSLLPLLNLSPAAGSPKGGER